MGLDNGMRLTWVGHATWILETPGGKRVLIDPWVTGNPVVPEHLNDPGPADVFLLTHGHSDHIGDVVQLAERHAPHAVLCIAELGVYLAVTAAATWWAEKGLLREAAGYVLGRRQPAPIA